MTTSTSIFIYDSDRIEVKNENTQSSYPAYIRINVGEFYLHFTSIAQITHLVNELTSIIDSYERCVVEETNAEVKE